jgi:hypothetical protein
MLGVTQATLKRSPMLEPLSQLRQLFLSIFLNLTKGVPRVVEISDPYSGRSSNSSRHCLKVFKSLSIARYPAIEKIISAS